MINGLVNYHGLPDIMHIMAEILNLILRLNFFRAYFFLKPQILFHSNGLFIQHGLPDITHVKYLTNG